MEAYDFQLLNFFVFRYPNLVAAHRTCQLEAVLTQLIEGGVERDCI